MSCSIRITDIVEVTDREFSRCRSPRKIACSFSAACRWMSTISITVSGASERSEFVAPRGRVWSSSCAVETSTSWILTEELPGQLRFDLDPPREMPAPSSGEGERL
jgi:hypothetical protein